MAYFYDSLTISSYIKNDEEATPESLRAAAKILEDKAKELETPKYTKRQLKCMNGEYDCITSDVFFTSKDGKRGWYGSSSRSEEGLICAEDGWVLKEGKPKERGYITTKKFGCLPVVMSSHYSEVYIDFERL